VLFGLVTAAFVLAFNYVVDPYGIVGSPRIAGLNEYKVDINEHSRLMKKYQPLMQSHNALVVGNSRVEMGIDPSHRCFSESGMTVYNLGIPGADVRTQLEYALNLIHQQPVQTVFLSVDFTDFISPRARSHDDSQPLLQETDGEFRHTAAGAPNPGYTLKAFKDYLKALFSLDALISSVRTVMLQSRVAPDRDAAGFNPGRDFEEAVRVEGPRALFDQKMEELAAKYSRPWYLRDSAGRLDPGFADLDAFLSTMSARGIKVYMFTNPFHGMYWQLFRAQGHMAVYEDWMRSMMELSARHRDTIVAFWDFSQDSPYLREEVPASGVKSGPLDWFWEPAHYRRQLGDLMVEAMLSEQCHSDGGFGERLR